jgi:LytS/YehU family sensor histidine kinase
MTNYLRVEHTHHGQQRLVWEINATPGARAAYVPTAFVQPLIENALKYGLRTSKPPLQLRILATVSGGELSVIVENSGEWIVPSPDGESRDSTGIGLANLRRRLVLLCGGQARLSVTTPAGLVRVEVRLPLADPPSAGQPASE